MSGLVTSCIILVLLFVFLTPLGPGALAAEPATYYVGQGTDASDTNSCKTAKTVTTPKLTITGAHGGLRCLTPGDTLIIKAGTYAEAIGVRRIPSGTSWIRPVTVKAAPGETVVLQPTRGGSGGDVIWIASQHYIILDGLIVDARHVNSKGIRLQALDEGDQTTHHIRILNVEVRNAKPGLGTRTTGGDCIGFNWRFGGVHSIEMRKLRLHDCGTTNQHHGVYIAGTDNTIEDSEIYNNSGHGVHMYDITQHTVDRNVARRNLVYNNGSWGVLIGSGNDNRAYENIVWRNGVTINGAGGMRIRFRTPRRNLLYNNTIHENTGRGIEISAGVINAVVRNNILYQNTAGDSVVEVAGSSGTIASHNFDSGNPLFVNAAARDYTLQSGSPAIDAGTKEICTASNVILGRCTSVLTLTNYVGANRDQGALERGAAAVPPIASSSSTTR